MNDGQTDRLIFCHLEEYGPEIILFSSTHGTVVPTIISGTMATNKQFFGVALCFVKFLLGLRSSFLHSLPPSFLSFLLSRTIYPLRLSVDGPPVRGVVKNMRGKKKPDTTLFEG